MVTSAAIASRLEGLPTIESDNQLRRFPPSFLRTCGRPPHVATTTSISPSLSRSPNAAPRPAHTDEEELLPEMERNGQQYS